MRPLTPPPTASADGVWRNLRLAPGLAQPTQPVADGAPAALVVQQGVLRWLGPQQALPAAFADLPKHDACRAWATPGLIDCHTHLVYGGQRAHEFALRLAGASYEEVARAGGGIVSSVRATRAASEDALYASALPRLQALMAEGVCAIEIKSGYGLALEHERKQLRVARRLGREQGITVRTTFLGAHALPPEYTGRSQDYIDHLCQQMLPALHGEGLVDAVDVFCERIAFSLAETEQVFATAQRLGLPVKLHAGQLSDMGGAQLAARYQALSCDHIEHLSPAGIAAMRTAGTVAVLLPGAYYTLRQPAAAQGRLRGLPRRLLAQRAGHPRQLRVPQPDPAAVQGRRPRHADREVPRPGHQPQPEPVLNGDGTVKAPRPRQPLHGHGVRGTGPPLQRGQQRRGRRALDAARCRAS
jgi:imidazolonepropionase